ncbi:MAG: bifunctional 2-polyprenyl-6-hydroxyphenol methylase/3-demethylubiquinol 3-O-methyltransferase UbiG [Acidimicrobiia bacterium]
MFDELSGTWWDESGVLHGLGVLLAPVRTPFVIEVLTELGNESRRVLDLGAGGGLLAEPIVAAGFSVVALDPSLLSLQAAKNHSALTDSGITFVGGVGEALPFLDASFDAVLCMEVLEHVDDAAPVVAEAGRVLRPGGIFIFAGPNRTVINGVGLLFVAQDLLGLVPRGTHQWSRLVRPDEMERYMRASGIEPTEMLGVGIRVRHVPRAALALIGLLARRLTHPETARQIELVTRRGKWLAYQGFGVRR